MTQASEELLRQAEALEKRALEIEGDSDSPLRVSAADVLWDRAEKLRIRASSSGGTNDTTK